MDTPITTSEQLRAEVDEIKADWKQADQKNLIIQARIAEALEALAGRCASWQLRMLVQDDANSFDSRCEEINEEDEENGW